MGDGPSAKSAVPKGGARLGRTAGPAHSDVSARGPLPDPLFWPPLCFGRRRTRTGALAVWHPFTLQFWPGVAPLMRLHSGWKYLPSGFSA